MKNQMKLLHLSREDYFDKVMGCWLGKNAGGTLGTPVEKMWGEREPFDLDFYPEIHAGGLPNDDLELQLVWVTLLEERGLGITCKDFSDYWVDRIFYNPDEYGCCKTSLRLGMQAPVSGWYNNPFNDCMGCPIRSEIWACIAPGQPDVAAHYSWHDAVVDHAMGESVNGEIFNATMQSMAFFCSDFHKLVEFGLSNIPADCMTARTIRLAMECHADGLSWLDARNRVMEFAYHPNGQHSPINLGFQTLGWLYGTDFGDKLCKAVNCGWDTDCTGATLGALYGIIHGAKALPEKWLEPLGYGLATSEGNGGLREGDYPRTIQELTGRCYQLALRVSAEFGGRVVLGGETSDQLDATTDLGDFCVSARMQEIARRRQDAVEYRVGSLRVSIAYPEQPVISAEKPAKVLVEIENTCPDPVGIAPSIIGTAEGIRVAGVPDSLPINGGDGTSFEMRISANGPQSIGKSICLYLRLVVEGRPFGEAVPIVLAGARRYEISRSRDDAADWRRVSFSGDLLAVEPFFEGKPGTLFLKHDVHFPQSEADTTIGVPTDGMMKLWMDGELIHQTGRRVPYRPSLRDDESNYIHLPVSAGWHQFVIELTRDTAPIQASFTLARGALQHGWHDAERTWIRDEAPTHLK